MTPRRTAEDVAAWKALSAEVLACARNPARATLDLERAVRKARKAVLPAPPFTAENPWYKLLLIAERFGGEIAAHRLDMASTLQEALTLAQGGPNPSGEGEPPRLPFRRDIDG